MYQPAGSSRSATADFPEGREEVVQHVYPPAPQKSRAQSIQPARDFPKYHHLIYYTPNLYTALHAQPPRTLATDTHISAIKTFSTRSAIKQHDANGRQSQRSYSPSDDDTPAHPAPVRAVGKEDDSDVPFLLALAHLPQRALDLSDALDSPETTVQGDALSTTATQVEPEAPRPAEGGENILILPTAESAPSTFHEDETKGGWNIAAWKGLNYITEERRSTLDGIDNMEETGPVQHGSKADDCNQAEQENFDEDWDHISQFQDD